MFDSTIDQPFFLSRYQDKRYLIIFLLGFAAGLPASLTASTLQAWFTEFGLQLHTIGAVSLLVLPYSLRFLWAPLFDHYHFPGLDRRKSWLLLMQLCIFVSIIIMANLMPGQQFHFLNFNIPSLMIIGFFVSIWASSLEIIINAYQTEILSPSERGPGASFYVTGWRLGTILSGAIALILAKKIGWHATYLLMAALSLIGIFATFIAPVSPTLPFNRPLSNRFTDPIKELIERLGAKHLLLFTLIILSYKLSDALALALNTTFLLRELHFDLMILGSVNKTVSITAAIFGGLLAGQLLKKISLYQCLIYFGFTQGFSALGYALLAYHGNNYLLLVLSAFLENFCSGMGNVALLALIMQLTHITFTATQIALLSALAYLSRPIVGPLAALLVEHLGWINFYVFCFLISLPTLFLIKSVKAYLSNSACSNNHGYK